MSAGLPSTSRAAFARFRRAAVSPRAFLECCLALLLSLNHRREDLLQIAGEHDVLHVGGAKFDPESRDLLGSGRQNVTADVIALLEDLLNLPRPDRLAQRKLKSQVEGLGVRATSLTALATSVMAYSAARLILMPTPSELTTSWPGTEIRRGLTSTFETALPGPMSQCRPGPSRPTNRPSR